MELYIGQKVRHKAVYKGKEVFEIIGIRRDHVELEGDFSGGTHCVTQKEWLPKDGLILSEEGLKEFYNRFTEQELVTMEEMNKSFSILVGISQSVVEAENFLGKNHGFTVLLRKKRAEQQDILSRMSYTEDHIKKLWENHHKAESLQKRLFGDEVFVKCVEIVDNKFNYHYVEAKRAGLHNEDLESDHVKIAIVLKDLSQEMGKMYASEFSNK